MNNQINIQNYGGSTFIVYTLENGETINKFINGMLTNNNIEGILPYSVSFGENAAELRFAAPPMLTLDNLIRRTDRPEVFFSILRNCLSVLTDADDYLIGAEHFILDQQYMYVDSTTLSVKLLCIATGKAQNDGISGFVRNYIYSANLRSGTEKIAAVHNYLNNNPGVTAAQLVLLIDELMTSGITAAQNNAFANAPLQNNPAQQPAYNSAPQASPAVQPPVYQQPVQGNPADKKNKGFSLFKGKQKDKNNAAYSMPAAQAPNSVPVQSGMAIPGKKIAPNGMAIPGTNTAPGGMAIPGQSAASAQNPAPVQKSVPNNGIPAQSMAQIQKPAAANMSPPNSNIPPVQGGENINGTVFVGMNQKNETVLISENNAPHLLSRNGKQIFINNNNFAIGKSNSGNFHIDYVVSNNRISRFHATIMKIGNDFFIIDNASTNGTFVNDARIASGVQVKLNNEDRVRLADEEFVFKC